MKLCDFCGIPGDFVKKLANFFVDNFLKNDIIIIEIKKRYKKLSKKKFKKSLDIISKNAIIKEPIGKREKKNLLKKIKKPIDKALKRCYNKSTKKG